MKSGLRLFVFYILAIQFVFGQALPSSEEVVDVDENGLRVTGTLPKVLKEASGLEVSRSGFLWTHNDDRYSVLYALDSLGNTLKTVHFNHPNYGWEDLTQDVKGNLYIGGFGNNKNDRRNLTIYKVPDPDHISDKIVTAEVIEYVYADQREFPPPDSRKNFDVDAFTSIGNFLYLFTKNRTQPFTGYTRIYQLPQEPGRHKAVLYDSIYLGNGPMMDYWITSADTSPDESRLALLSHDCIWIISDFQNRPFSAGNILKINLNHFSHKAGLSFVSDTEVYLVDELEFGFLGGKIYSLDLAAVFNKIDAGAATVRQKLMNEASRQEKD